MKLSECVAVPVSRLPILRQICVFSQHRHNTSTPSPYIAKMVEYFSQEEAIYARAKRLGIDLDTVWEYFDKLIVRVTNHHPAQSPDWRLEKAERGVWSKFCLCSISG